MKINRKRIQNSCAYFSSSSCFCCCCCFLLYFFSGFLEELFSSSTFCHLTRILTNRWRVGYSVVFCVLYFVHNRKSDFSVECLDFTIPITLLPTHILIGQMHFTCFHPLYRSLCIELEIDFCRKKNHFSKAFLKLSTHSADTPHHRKSQFTQLFIVCVYVPC